MIIEKYRVHEVAKDLDVPSKDVADLLGKYFDSPKKHMTALTEEELNLVFEKYTTENSVQSFDEYFASGAEKKAQQKPKAEEVKPVAPQAAPAATQANAAQAAAANNTPAAQKPIQAVNTSTQQKPLPPKPVQPVAAMQQPKPLQQAQPANQTAQPQRTFQQNNNRPQQGGFKPNNNQQGNNRPQQGGFKPNNNQQGNNRPQQGGFKPNNNQQGNNRPQQGGFRPNNNQILNQHKQAMQNKPAVSVSVGGGDNENISNTRVVDMRTSHVNLDKYNEKYEQLAPTGYEKKDNGIKKQKLTQRSAQRGKPVMSRKEQEAEKLRRLDLERQRRQKLEITLPDEISVSDLAAKLKVQAAEVVKKLMLNGIMASASEIIDYDTAALVAMEIGAKVEHEVVVTIEERLFDETEDKDEQLVQRSPVVVVMGHVDHGKTSLLDAIRNAHVTEGEAGGITQHIGAYQVAINNKMITFLDTPGHAAFTAMRARGAKITDIAVLVVAADDGIMPQTVEAINHAKAAGISIIVAINKMDKPGANPDKIKQSLTEYELVPEEWGGDVICVPVSAKTKYNIDTLLEMIQLVADMKELKANPDRFAKGTVIEAKLDKGKGPVASVLVQNGTLKTGDIIIAGTALGKVRVMLDDRGRKVEQAGPSMPVEITGLGEVPLAGDTFNVVEDEKLARELVEKRKQEAKEEQFSSYQKVTLDNLFDQISQGEMKELPVIVKADVQGSVEAVKQSLEKLSNEEVRVKVIHGAVGAVSEFDVMLANASNAIIVGFNVRPDPVARDNAERDGVEIRLYRIIYDAIDEIKSAMKGMLAPKIREVELGRTEVRAVYRITNVGVVAGCYVLEGKITRTANIRVVRDGIIIADDKLDSLKRFKDDAKEVAQGYECGVTLSKYNDIKEGDIFEAYVLEEYREE